MNAADWQLLLEFTKVVLAWPPISLAITFVVLFRFRASIEDLIRRLTKGKILGQEFEAHPPTQRPAVNLEVTARLPDVATPEQPKVPSLSNGQPTLPAELANDAQAQSALKFVQENPIQAVLDMRRLAFAYGAERVFNQIYGTQLALLEFLSLRRGQPAKLVELAHFHTEHQRLAGTTRYEIQPYMDFLVSSGFLISEQAQQAHAVSQ